MSSLIQDFVNYLFDKSIQINADVYGRAEECLEDYIPVTRAGAAKNKDHWEKLLKSMPDGNAELVGYTKKVDSKTAALINGFNAHSLELDDGHRFAMIHLGASIISAIKAASNDSEICRQDLLKGIIMGYEAACRTALAIQPSHKKRGFHAAGTCGTIGASIGVAFSLGQSKTQVARALTCAVGSATGLLEIQEQGSELKPFNVGRASMDGLMSAYMGLSDFELPDDILGGERGFFRTFADMFSIERLTERTDYFEIERIYVKPYASCRHSHSAVEAAIRLHEELDVKNITDIEVLTYKLGVKGHDHTNIQGVASAKLSTPYAVAAGLLLGRADLTVFEPLDETIIRLAQKVRVMEDPVLTAESSRKRIAIVKVKLANDVIRECRIDFAKGEPENPMSKEEREEKKKTLLEYIAKKNTDGEKEGDFL